MVEFRSKELYADFYGNSGKPLIVLIGGSQKGIAVIAPQLLDYLKEHYNVLVFAYFGVGDLPAYLEKIPLEYFIKGIDQVKIKYALQNQNVSIIGNSKGGEAALLLTRFISPRVTIACVPSCYAWQGIPHGLLSVFFPRSSWTLNQKQIPFIRLKFDQQARQDIKNKIYYSSYKNAITPQANREAKIDLSQYSGKLLLLSAEVDNYWPSREMCNEIEQDAKIDVTHKILNLSGHHFLEYDESIKEIIDFLEATR
jgi:esterase/lipase